MKTTKDFFSFHYDTVAPFIYGLAVRALDSVADADKVLTEVCLSLEHDQYFTTGKTIATHVLLKTFARIISRLKPNHHINLRAIMDNTEKRRSVLKQECILEYSHVTIDYEFDVDTYKSCTTRLWRFRAKQKMNASLNASRQAIAYYNQLARECRSADAMEAQRIMSEMKTVALKWRTELEAYKKLSSVYNSALVAL